MFRHEAEHRFLRPDERSPPYICRDALKQSESFCGLPAKVRSEVPFDNAEDFSLSATAGNDATQRLEGGGEVGVPNL